jgi:hypothetical protein
MIRLIPLALALAAAGCAPPSEMAQAPMPAGVDCSQMPGGAEVNAIYAGCPQPTACGAEKLDGLIGRQQGPETIAEAKRLSGAERIRWIAPGTAVTMDYSEARLNIRIDETGKIVSAKCG